MATKHLPRLGPRARILALLMVLGTLIGSPLPELGNVAAFVQKLGTGKGHAYNPVFLVVGLMGIVCSGVALYTGYEDSRTPALASGRTAFPRMVQIEYSMAMAASGLAIYFLLMLITL